MTRLLFLMISACLLSGQVKDIDGWASTKWGMSVEEVRAAVGNRAAKAPLAIDPRFQSFENVADIDVAGIPMQLSLSFTLEKPQLFEAYLSLHHPNGTGTGEAEFDTLKRLLIERYGVPADQQEKKNSRPGETLDRTVFWRLPSTSISLSWLESKEFDGGLVSVDYTRVEKTPL